MVRVKARMCGKGTRSQVQILSLVKYTDLPGASCSGCGQNPEVRVPMESPKGLAMKGSSVFKKKKKGSNWLIQYVSKKKLVKEVLDISAIIKHC